MSGDDIGRLSGGPLQSGSTYKILQLHFHWGANDCMGSEHTINGIRSGNLISLFVFLHYILLRFPIDLHLVHQTRGPRNQLAVTAFQFEV